MNVAHCTFYTLQHQMSNKMLTREPEPEPESKSKSAKQEVFTNPLILKKILSHLGNPQDLLNCRAVASSWKSLATEILLQRRSLKISIWYNAKVGAYFKLENKHYFFRPFNSRPNSNPASAPASTLSFAFLNKFSLENLLDLIKSARVGGSRFRFPCVSFQIVAGDLETRDLSSFLQFYGEKVEKLGLSFYPYGKKKRRRLRLPWLPLSSSSIGKLYFPQVSAVRNLLVQLPNLKELEFFRNCHSPEWKWNDSFDFYHFFQEFEFELETESAGTKTKILATISPGQEKKKKKILMISQLPKLEKLCFEISDYHDFHRFYGYSDTQNPPNPLNPPKSVIQKNIRDCKSVEFSSLFEMDASCKDCFKALVFSGQVEKLGTFNTKALGLDLDLDANFHVMENMVDRLDFDELHIDFEPQTILKIIRNQLMKKRMISVLNAIFKRAAISSDTKIPVHIKIKRPIGFLSDADFEIPVMENVSKVTLEKPQKRESAFLNFPFFPCGFNLSASFPNLKTIELKNWRGDISSDLWGQNSQSQSSSLPTVKNFSICTSREHVEEFSAAGFLKLSKIFPKLVRMEIRNFNNFPAVAKCFSKFKRLQELTIGLDFRSYSKLNSIKLRALDSALTGFTMETCQKLWDSQEFQNWAKNAAKNKKEENAERDRKKRPLKLPKWLSIQSLRVNPSICDLPNVQKVVIEFRDGVYSPNEYNLPIPDWSGLLALYFMPQLQIHIVPGLPHSTPSES